MLKILSFDDLPSVIDVNELIRLHRPNSKEESRDYGRFAFSKYENTRRLAEAPKWRKLLYKNHSAQDKEGSYSSTTRENDTREAKRREPEIFAQPSGFNTSPCRHTI